MLLGAASYAIYLVHLPVLAVMHKVARYVPGMEYGMGQLVFSAASIGAGIALHLCFERPVGRLLRNRPWSSSPVSPPMRQATDTPGQ